MDAAAFAARPAYGLRVDDTESAQGGVDRGDEKGRAPERGKGAHPRVRCLCARVVCMSLSALSKTAVACLAAAVCLPAATADPWLKITSANFELYTTAGERAGRDLIRHFEQVRGFFMQAFGSRLPGKRPARIVAFRNEKEFLPYRPSEAAAAFYQPGQLHDFIVMRSASADHYPMAVHEYTHLLIHQTEMEIPLWLNEGLAELYSNLVPRGDKILVGQVIPGRLQILRTERWIPLPALLAANHDSPLYNEKTRAGMFYAETWALVHMLNLDPEYRPHLQELVTALKGSAPGEAFTKAYHKPLGEVEAALRTYFDGTTVKAQLFNVQLPKALDAPAIEAGAGLAVRLALAEMLTGRRGARDQAREELSAIAREYPDRWEVEEGLAQFAWRERRLDESARHFARAVELGCDGEQSLLLYARVLGYNDQSAQEATVLRRALKQYPESAEVQLELGATLVRTGNYGAAAAALMGIRKVETAEEAYRLLYNLAYAQYRLGDSGSARENLRKAETHARKPDERAAIQRLRESLNRPGAVDAAAPAARVAPPVALPAVEGTLESMECGEVARLHVRVGESEKVFVIPDPAIVTIGGENGTPVELECGPQKPPRRLRIEFQVLPSMPAVTGIVRTLKFNP